jgi:hypothetical protein
MLKYKSAATNIGTGISSIPRRISAEKIKYRYRTGMDDLLRIVGITGILERLMKISGIFIIQIVRGQITASSKPPPISIYIIKGQYHEHILYMKISGILIIQIVRGQITATSKPPPINIYILKGQYHEHIYMKISGIIIIQIVRGQITATSKPPPISIYILKGQYHKPV